MAEPDALVIGGGFYGCCLAIHLRRRFGRVLLVEEADGLLTRASRVNQARLHNGYHYPRSFLTAARSRSNLEVFRRRFPGGVFDDFRHLYAIARADSKVGHRHFERFAAAIGARLEAAGPADRRLFAPRLVEAVYEVVEPAFDVAALRRLLVGRMAESGVEVRTSMRVVRLGAAGAGVAVGFADGTGLRAGWVFNCTYAALNRVVPEAVELRPRLVHQLAEVALITAPPALRRLGITVMDGPFFSAMPFPSEGLHSLTHVRYTPHMSWPEASAPARDPNAVLHPLPSSRFAWMMRDARRYVPALEGAVHVRSLFDIKTLVDGTQGDDARPILFHRDATAPRLVSILGSKLDNIFDVLDTVDETLERA
ncbi:MAG: FAD-binding oxidoreductase [Acetobacteraceae bacterium]|nr:FAD-binding oxidoreductase [Acetobacteraceae bacterium]